MTHPVSPCPEPSTALAAGGDKWEEKVRSETPLSALQGDLPGGPVAETLFSNAGDSSVIPAWGPKVLHATWLGPKIRKKDLFKKG